jgi:purine-binding chemotaxis protein CheW
MKPYLIFNLNNLKYGIDPLVVKEIFLLPELMPIAQTPLDIVGILNLRGEVIPVMHLELRLGGSFSECHLNDSIVVVEQGDLTLGMIVNTVQEVMMIESQQIQAQVDYQQLRAGNQSSIPINSAFISGIAKVEEEMIVLLNPDALIREPDAVKNLLNPSEHQEEIAPSPKEQSIFTSNFYERCCPQATPEERNIFRQRAEALAQTLSEGKEEATEQSPLAVVSLNGEYFGLDLAKVREFTKVSSFTSIPCCPQHIIGNMNLRGEILTLVDIRPTLNLEASSVSTGSQAVVVQVDDIVAGLPVDEVLDVMYVRSEEIDSVPIAISANSDYFQGNTAYSERIITILDLDKLITEGELVVNETV